MAVVFSLESVPLSTRLMMQHGKRNLMATACVRQSTISRHQRKLLATNVLWKIIIVFAACSVINNFLVLVKYEGRSDEVGPFDRAAVTTAKNVSQTEPCRSSFVGGEKNDARFPHFTILPSHACGEETVSFVIIVFSYVSNFMSRIFIRKTWGGYANERGNNATLVFLVALNGTPSHDYTQKHLEREAEVFGDILQVRFQEHYRNLSLKSIAMLNWVSEHCQNSQYLLKADDDVYVNAPLLARQLVKMSTGSFSKVNFVLGGIGSRKPHGNKESKWYTSKKEFNGYVYPPFVSGTAYAMTRRTALRLYAATHRVARFWLEDVYITGMCALKAGVKVVTNRLFSLRRTPLGDCDIRTYYSIHGLTLFIYHSIPLLLTAHSTFYFSTEMTHSFMKTAAWLLMALCTIILIIDIIVYKTSSLIIIANSKMANLSLVLIFTGSQNSSDQADALRILKMVQSYGYNASSTNVQTGSRKSDNPNGQGNLNLSEISASYHNLSASENSGSQYKSNITK
ncbi:UDP-GalNAc:beta-1,3-N-acetylgalactosaminyltransferase 1 [Bulinus truncatus]|nr:UDP-GalNAc:beta-1,3-N-acetylgalactosaminyltransferase 1 [Bulinus truncatus]